MNSRSGILAFLSIAVFLLGSRALLRGQEDDLVLRFAAPTGEVTSGSEFDAAVLFDTLIDGIQGWSLGVAHDAEALELLEVEYGATTQTVKNGQEPEFVVVNTEPAVGTGVVMAVVISFKLPITLDTGEGYELLKMRYKVIADPTQVDPCLPVETTLEFSSAIGDPPVSTVITVLGVTRTPTTVPATITVRCPGSIEITRCEADTRNVYLEWAFAGPPTWDFLFLYRDGEFLASLEIDATSYTDEGLEGGDYEYTLFTFVVDDPSSPSLIAAYCTATVIPLTVTSIEPTMGNWIGGDEVTVVGTGFTTVEATTLVFFDETREIPLEIIDIVSETELRAATPPSPRLGLFDLRVENDRGSAELPDAFEYGFLRGDANADGDVDISDTTYILTYLFLGTQAPLCEKSADSTDDGMLDVSDAIRIVSYLFRGDSPPPAPPYPDPGQDPTPDTLTCLE